jgi:hypothetical protein
LVRACSHERLGASFLDEVAILIENSPMPRDDASASFGLRLQRLDGRHRVDRITKDDRTKKLPFEDGHECQRIDARSLAHQSRGDGQTEQSMSDGPSERITLGGRMIDVQRIEVTRETGKEDDIGFRDGSSWTLPFVTDDKVIERAD